MAGKGKNAKKGKAKGIVLETKTNDKAVEINPALIEMVFDAEKKLVKLDKFTSDELDSFVKDKKLKATKKELDATIWYCRFFAGKTIDRDKYDLFKHRVKKSYRIWHGVEPRIKKVEGEDKEVLVPVCRCLNYADMEAKQKAGTLLEEDKLAFEKLNHYNNAEMKEAQSNKATITALQRKAESIIEKRKGDAIAVKVDDLKALWLKVTGKTDGIFVTPMKESPEKRILETFC